MESPKQSTFDGISAPYDAVPEGQPDQVDQIYPRGWRLCLITAGYLCSCVLVFHMHLLISFKGSVERISGESRGHNREHCLDKHNGRLEWL